MILTLLRHGETDLNAKRIIQGAFTNAVLNDLGKSQIRDAAINLRKENTNYDIIGATLLSRSLESAQIVNDILHISDKLLVNQHLMERDYGTYELMSLDEFYDLRSNGKITDESYESDQDMLIRIFYAINNLFLEYKERNLLFVVHSQVIKAALMLTKTPSYDFTSLIKNAEYFTFSVTKSGIKLIK